VETILKISKKGIHMLDILEIMNSPEPSLNIRENWLSSYVKNEYKTHTSNGGKWLIFCDRKDINKTWKKVKKLLENNKLGNIAKVSTAKDSSLKSKEKPTQHVICVYTYDFDDFDDIKRINTNLKKGLGLKWVIPYKKDIDTINGVYGTDKEFCLWM
jgi:hypothetical protein